MKTVFAVISSGSEVKNLLLGDFYKILKERQDIRLVAFVPPEKADRYGKELEYERCIVEPIPKVQSSRLKEIFQIVVLSSIPTRTIWTRQEFARLNGGSLMAFLSKRCFWLLGHFKIYRAFLRFVEYHLFRDDKAWIPYFKKYLPDAVFGAALKFDDTVGLMKAACRREIPCVGMTGGWDNISSKLFLRVHPNLMLVQNSTMLGELEELNDYSRSKSRVVGFPQWDHYKDPAWEMSKEEVAKAIGADPKKRWISYFTGGLFVGGLAFEDLRDQADILIKAIERGELKNCQLLVRIHPIDPVKLETQSPHVRVVDFGKGFEFSAADTKLLANLVRLSDVTINFGSTMTLEAAIFDKPIIAIGFNGYADQKIPMHRRLSYALANTNHYFPIKKSGGAWHAKNPEDFLNAVKTYLENPSLHHEGRLRIMEWLVGPFDGKASQRVVDAILSVTK